MSFNFPAGHPFANSPDAPSSAVPSPTYNMPSLIGPLPPRRRARPSPTPLQTHTRSSSSASTSSTSSNASYLLLTPTSSRTTTPTPDSDSESEDEFIKRLSSLPKQFGAASSRPSSQSTLTSDFESFVAGLEGSKRQFGSTGRRGGMELSERHERAAEVLEAEVEEAELRSAVRVACIGRAL